MRSHRFVRGAAVLAALAALASCDNTVDIIRPQPAVGGEIFATYISIGDSYPAGYYSSGINEQQQLTSFTALFANQAGTRFALPLLNMPGCPPPVVNVFTQEKLGGANAPPCSLRDPRSVTAQLNNYAVPGFFAADPTSLIGPGSSVLSQLILGGETQVQRAIEAKPTFITVAFVGNDVLDARTGYIDPTSTPIVSRGVTPPAAFIQSYENIVNPLVTAGIKRGVLFAVADLTQSPIFFPAVALSNPAFKAGFDALVGKPVTVLPNCTNSLSLLSLEMPFAMRQGALPPVVGCEKNSVPGTPVGDIFVLDATEIATVKARIGAYNAFIKAKADSIGYGFFDTNLQLANLKAANLIYTVPRLDQPATPFGPAISLDPAHPSVLGHKYLANALIDVVNAKYGTSVPKVTVP